MISVWELLTPYVKVNVVLICQYWETQDNVVTLPSFYTPQEMELLTYVKDHMRPQGTMAVGNNPIAITNLETIYL